ncbi:MAG: HD domain-containing protein, partial [Bryobacteraceae bacterium]
PEEWMRIFFRHARPVYQCALRSLEYVDEQGVSLVRQFRDWRGRLSNSEFTVSRERVFLRNPPETFSSPESVLRLFTFVARHGIQLSWDAQRRLRSALSSFSEAFENHPPSWTAWRELLSQPHTALALRQMQETDFLPVAIPEWRVMESLVVRDFYHRYTVDEHTLVAIEAIDKLTAPRFRQLLIEDDEPAILRLALLLHDVGKGTAPGDHVRGSLEAAATLLHRLRVPEDVQEVVHFLIEHHLDLSQIMNGRDLDDPATARFLASKIGTQEKLRRLALLTYADISAVNPSAMTPWRLEQLWRVYSIGLQQLTRELETDRVHDAAASLELARFLEGLPTRYVRTHSREQMERHLKLEQKSEREGVAVEIQSHADAHLMTVVAADEPGLFAALCGTLASFGMNIVRAEAYANAARRAVDMIRFTDPIRTLELNPAEIDRLQWTVECVVRRSVQVTDLLKRRRSAPRPTGGAKITPALRFNNEASETSTLIDFVAEDRPGLLYDLTSAISAAGCNIEVVMIDTQAHKALDVFYVTRDGKKLDQAAQDQLEVDLIRHA